MSGITSIPKYNSGVGAGGSVLGAAGGASLANGSMQSQSVPAIGGIGSYKYTGGGIGGPVGSLAQAPAYNFGSIPKYSTSGIAGGIGSLGPLGSGGSGAGQAEEGFGGRNKF